MAQPSVIVVTLVMLGTLGGLVYVHVTRDTDSDEHVVPEVVAPADAQAVTVPASAPDAIIPLPESHAQSIEQAAVRNVARLIADAQSYDPSTRASAIESLGRAPVAQALPALERVLESGEPQVDRQIALRSLHTLALSDGDTNGKIRDVMRHAMYHSEDEAVTQTAQALLEDIEAAFDERAQNGH